MRANENVALYCVLPDSERKKHMKIHKKRVKDMKGVLTKNDLKYTKKDNNHNQDSSKISSLRYGSDAVIAKNNLVLAKRIFEIMEGPGIISDLMQSDVNTHKTGTINFPHRLAEAKRIHNENLIIASRLDAIQPTYYDKSTVNAVRKGSPTKGRRPVKQKQRQKEQPGGLEGVTQRSVVQGSRSEDKPPKQKNVLLEYSKIQRGRVLDVAVIKEPFRDSYSIFGIDIDNGQRYELKLSSEEVTNILEGDILVTSVDNPEVWMALLSKVELSPVEAFSKTPLPNGSHNHGSHSESKKSTKPTKPTTLNSSRNQKNNPRNNKILKKESDVSTADIAVSSVGSSSAVNGTDDDFSLTTGGDDENEVETQHNELDNDGGGGFSREGGDDLGGDMEDGDSTKGYTLDEYYEDHAPLSPLPSQTGFVTSAPSGKQRDGAGGSSDESSAAAASSAAAVKSLAFNGFGAEPHTHTALVAVKYILDTAVKNILLSRFHGRENGDPPTDMVASKPRPAPPPPLKTSNPYTSTTISAAPRSHSIMYKQVPTGLGKERVEKSGEDKGKKELPPHTPEEITESQNNKEPQKPKETAPLSGNRRPTHRQRQTTDTGSAKKKTPHAVAESTRKKSQAVVDGSSSSSSSSSRKKSSAADGAGARRVSTFRRPVDPMLGVTTVSPRVAELAVKTALKRVGEIVELFDLELPPT